MNMKYITYIPDSSIEANLFWDMDGVYKRQVVYVNGT